MQHFFDLSKGFVTCVTIFQSEFKLVIETVTFSKIPTYYFIEFC